MDVREIGLSVNWSEMAGFFEHCNEPLGCIKAGKYLAR
jgi:hypothetical protein